MARQNPVPQWEKEICARLRQAREGAHLSRVALAGLLGMDSSRLASYEHARVPVKFKLARDCSVITGVSLLWLAIGQDRPERIYIPDEKLRGIADNKLFSEVYNEHLKPLYDAVVSHPRKLERGALDDKSLDAKLGLFGVIGGGSPNARNVQVVLNQHIDDAVAATPPALLDALFSEVAFTLNKFRRNHFEAIQAYAKLEAAKKDLTDAAIMVHADDVKPQLPSLLERLQKATQDSGRKSELAKFLNVPLASVSRWLSGAREPGGEITLKLLKWVEQQERQK